MKKLLLCAPLLLALTVAAQTTTQIQPGNCTSSGPANHCGFVDENGTHGLVNTGYPGNYIDFGTEEYALSPINTDYTDPNKDDQYPVVVVQANSDGAGKTVTVILHGYKHQATRYTKTLYITSGSVTID